MESHLAKGRIGEEIACRYLEGLGYSILERNWRYRHKEVDIIASTGVELVIVEVKTRSAGSLLGAREVVDGDKQRNLIEAADRYVRLHALTLSVRFDIIALDIASDSSYTMEHIPNAFYPSLRLRPRRTNKRR